MKTREEYIDFLVNKWFECHVTLTKDNYLLFKEFTQFFLDEEKKK